MYIRKTQIQKKKADGHYYTYRIDESQRIGQLSVFEIDSEIEKGAGTYAARIIARQQEESDGKIDCRDVDIDSLEMNRPRNVGCEHVTLEALRMLELDCKLEQSGFIGPQVALAIGTIVGRACHPASESETHRWLQDQSGLGELIGHNFEEASLYKMYQVSDLLLKRQSFFTTI